MIDQAVIDERWLVVAVEPQSLMITVGEMVSDHQFAYNPADSELVIITHPLRELKPLASHVEQLRTIVHRHVNITAAFQED